jgi:hypothetical protein
LAGGQLVISKVEDNYSDGGKNASQKLKPTFPDCKDPNQIVSETVKMVQDIKYASADYARDKGIQRDIGNHLRVGRDISAEAPDDMRSQQKTNDQHQAIALNRQRRKWYSE